MNAEGEASALVIAEHLAQLRVLFRERKEAVETQKSHHKNVMANFVFTVNFADPRGSSPFVMIEIQAKRAL